MNGEIELISSLADIVEDFVYTDENIRWEDGVREVAIADLEYVRANVKTPEF